MNGYAVQDAHIKHAQAQRDAAAKALTERQEQSRQRMLRARDMLEQHAPDLTVDGRVDDYAVWSLLELWAERGEGNVTAGAVRARYAEKKAALIARLGWNPWTEEGPADDS